MTKFKNSFRPFFAKKFRMDSILPLAMCELFSITSFFWCRCVDEFYLYSAGRPCEFVKFLLDSHLMQRAVNVVDELQGSNCCLFILASRLWDFCSAN